VAVDILEYWNTGTLEYWGKAKIKGQKNQPTPEPYFWVSHYSMIPSFHYSITLLELREEAWNG
jgi:hypothetical protein